MGVIDLNARVRALEENASNSQEIDQIEADLTALEETVNGDGEQDLGLVGAVAALEEAAVPVKTDITLNENCGYTPISGDGGCCYYVVGNIVHLCISCEISITPATLTEIATLPAAVRPPHNLYLVGFGKEYGKYSRLVIAASTGVMTANCDDVKMRVYATYPINVATT